MHIVTLPILSIPHCSPTLLQWGLGGGVGPVGSPGCVGSGGACWGVGGLGAVVRDGGGESNTP